jgi:hypothetical protein
MHFACQFTRTRKEAIDEGKSLKLEARKGKPVKSDSRAD